MSLGEIKAQYGPILCGEKLVLNITKMLSKDCKRKQKKILLGNKLKDTIPLLNHLLKKDIISLETYKMFIARNYCVRFKKSPVKSVHCEQDESLMIMVKEEFPHFHQLYIKNQN